MSESYELVWRGRSSQGPIGKRTVVDQRGMPLAICERHFPIIGTGHDMMEPLLQEINRLYGVNHPNVMNCIRAAYVRDGPTHPFVVITLEFMDRFSLREVYSAFPPHVQMPELLLAHIARGVLQGLAALQTRPNNIIHRDVKPSNILINSAGAVRLSDFAVSAKLGHSFDKTKTQVGTYAYFAPERVDVLSYTANTDVWSLGVTLVEALTKRVPYPPPDYVDDSQNSVLDSIMECPAPVPPPGTVSEEFRSFLSDCFERDMERRKYAPTMLEHPWLQCAADLDPNLLLQCTVQPPSI